MAKVVDSGGELVILGHSLVLPSDTPPTAPLIGAVRYNSPDGTIKAYVHAGGSFAWVTLTAGSGADLAERYHADAVYDAGTVVVIGGEHEITACSTVGDSAVVGVISTNPAYKMNLFAGDDDSHPFVALRGRVPCKVTGTIRKGDLLTTSSVIGYAQAADDAIRSHAIIGKALQDYTGDAGVIEVLV
jgi:hypothetical protein